MREIHCRELLQLGEHSFIDLIEHFFNCVSAKIGAHHRKRRAPFKSFLRFRKPAARLVGITEDIDGKLPKPGDARQPVRLIDVERLISLAAMLEGSRGDDDFQKIFERKTGVCGELFELRDGETALYLFPVGLKTGNIDGRSRWLLKGTRCGLPP